MKSLLKSLKKLPWIVKLLLVIFYDIFGSLIRLARSVVKKNTLGIVLAVILLFTGGLIILWIVDIIFTILGKDIWWID